jgi:hypothetical protein
MSSSRYSVFQDVHVPNKQYLAQQKSTVLDSVMWTDDTDTICDLPCLLTYLDNHVNNRHKTDGTRHPTTGGSFHRDSNGVVTPSSLPSPCSIPQAPLLPRHVPVSSPLPTTGVLTGIHSQPVDLVDSLSRSGSFPFLTTCSTQNVFSSSVIFA